MIEVVNLKKCYDKNIVLESLDMHVKHGSIYGLIGINGAGKSTLLNVLSGVFKPDGGEAKINGEEIYENISVKNITAYITDDPYFFNRATVVEMAEFLSKMYKSFSMEKFYEIAKSFEIDINAKMSSFSKGMRRQAEIILALAQNPEILLCDECFDGLDPSVRKVVKRLFITEACEKNTTIVISSHNLTEMENLCDTIGIMSGKKIVTEKSVEGMKNHIHRYSVAYKPMINPDLLKAELDVVTLLKKGSLLDIVVRGDEESIEKVLGKYNPVLLDKSQLTLEDIFISQTEGKGAVTDESLV